MLKTRTALLVTLILAFAVAGTACDGGTDGDAPETPGAIEGQAEYGDLILASEINTETKEPTNQVTSFPTSATAMHAAIKVRNARAGSIFQFRWTKGTQEARTVVVNLAQDAADTWVTGSVFPNGALPAGEDWLVAVFVDGNLVGSAPFTVQ